MGGRRRVSLGSRVKGIGRVALGGVVLATSPLTLGRSAGVGGRMISKGARAAFARTGRGSGSGGRQKGHPFYGNQYVKVSSARRARRGR
jgi:hypothetical protein